MNNNLIIDDEFKNLAPPLTWEELAQLEKNILSDGCRDALIVWDGVIIDGHNRYAICEKHGIPFEILPMDFENRAAAKEWIILNQFGRRNLTAMQRSELALHLKPIIAEKADSRMKAGVKQDDPMLKSAQGQKGTTRNELARIAGVGHDTIAKAEKILNNGTPEQIERARTGGQHNSVNAIYNEIKHQEPPGKRSSMRKQMEEVIRSIKDPELTKNICITPDSKARELAVNMMSFCNTLLHWYIEGEYPLNEASRASKEEVAAAVGELETMIISLKNLIR